MRLWRKDGIEGGKYLVRGALDGSVLQHPNMVIGARDPCAPAALRAYADEAERIFYNGRVATGPSRPYAITRRDGTAPSWEGVVLHALDPCAPAALRAYAVAARGEGLDPNYAADVEKLAAEFEAYAAEDERSASSAVFPAGYPTGRRVEGPPLGLSRLVDALAVGMSSAYAARVREIADDFERYRREHGPGDPDAKPHRTDDPATVALMAAGRTV